VAEQTAHDGGLYLVRAAVRDVLRPATAARIGQRPAALVLEWVTLAAPGTALVPTLDEAEKC
jgi:hypothetical protein